MGAANQYGGTKMGAANQYDSTNMGAANQHGKTNMSAANQYVNAKISENCIRIVHGYARVDGRMGRVCPQDSRSLDIDIGSMGRVCPQNSKRPCLQAWTCTDYRTSQK